MNILIVSHYSSLYGANRSLLNLIRGLSSYPVSLKVLCRSDGDLGKELKKLNIPYEIAPFNLNSASGRISFPRVCKRTLVNLFLGIKYYLENRNEKYDYIYSNSYIINFGFLLSRLYVTKHIFHLREMGGLHYNFKYLAPKLSRYCIVQSEKIICVSESVKSHFNVSNAFVIYDSVLKNIQIKQRISTENMIIGMVGVISEGKGFHLVLKELAPKVKLLNLKIIIYGSGDQKLQTTYQEIISKHDLNDFVLLKGYETDINKIFNSFDLLIMPSRNEALGRVTMEAMCFGIPVIGHNSSGTSELITSGLNGFLYDNEIELEKLIKNVDQNYEVLSRSAYNSAQNFLEAPYSHKIYEFLNR